MYRGLGIRKDEKKSKVKKKNNKKNKQKIPIDKI